MNRLSLKDIVLKDSTLSENTGNITADISIVDGKAKIIINKNGKKIDLNAIADKTPGGKKEIEKDFIGIMIHALERLKAKGSDHFKAVEEAIIKILGVEDNPEYISKNRQLSQYKNNMLDKYTK